jgi:hypothetical protein
MREATRTPMPSLRPKRFGSMRQVYREQGPEVRVQPHTPLRVLRATGMNETLAGGMVHE